MKRIVSSILVMIMILSLCVVPFAEEITDTTVDTTPKTQSTIVVADQSTVVMVTGTTKADSEVAIEVLKPGKAQTDADAFEYLDQTASDANGAYAFEFKMTAATDAIYTIKVKTPRQMHTVSYDYKYAVNVIDAFNDLTIAGLTADDATLGSTFNSTKNVLGINTPLVQEMGNQGISLLSEIRAISAAGYNVNEISAFIKDFMDRCVLKAVNNFNAASLVRLFDDADAISGVGNLGLVEGEIALGGATENAARYERYAKMTAAMQTSVANYIVVNRPYATLSAALLGVNDGIMVTEFANMEFPTSVREFVENNQDKLSNFAAYDALTDTQKLVAAQYVFNNKHVATTPVGIDALLAGAIGASGATPTPAPTYAPNPGGPNGSSGTTISTGGKATPTPVPSAEALFTDIDSVPWAQEAINTLAKDGVINGKGDKIFAPDDLITREEFSKMAVLAFGLYNDRALCNFTDVPTTAWSYKYIGSAVSASLIYGKGDGTVGVSDLVTREDVAAICYRAGIAKGAGFTKLEDKEITFTDKDSISEYAKRSVDVLTQVGAINGMGDGTFAPKGTCTRAQAAKIIYVVRGLMN